MTVSGSWITKRDVRIPKWEIAVKERTTIKGFKRHMRLSNLHPERVYRVCSREDITDKERKYEQKKNNEGVKVIPPFAPFIGAKK